MQIKNFTFEIEQDPTRNNRLYAVIIRVDDNLSEVIFGSNKKILLKKIEKAIDWQNKNNPINAKEVKKELKELAF
jgi:hypothetical protein